MSTTLDRAGFWDDGVWASIDAAVTTSVSAIRVAQKVFPAQVLAGTTSVPADIFDPRKMSIAEGVTKPFIELAVEFSLTNGQVNDDTTGSTAIALSKFAAKSLALAEDLIILRGDKATLPVGVRVESGAGSASGGLLGDVTLPTINVAAPNPAAPTNSGGPILAAIATAISVLSNSGNVQAPPYALIAGTNAFAETWGSVINGAPAYSVLDPVLTGGIYGTGGMPDDSALLVALGGDPTTIYMSSDALTEPTYKGAGGLYFFRTFERVQFVARDSRAFIRLDFPHLAGRRAGGGAPAGGRAKEGTEP